jgi:membrane protein implicated in regulation of membrane protease activity
MKNLFNESNIEMLATPVSGIVELAITPNQKGRVECQGSYWPARFYSDCQTMVQPEQPVKVVAMQGITLLVQPAL